MAELDGRTDGDLGTETGDTQVVVGARGHKRLVLGLGWGRGKDSY